MLYFKGKEDMGLDASLKLLDLSPDATIDDANQAYTYLHQMVDLFHREVPEVAKESVASCVLTGRLSDMPVTLAAEKLYFSGLGTMQNRIGISDISRTASVAASVPIARINDGRLERIRWKIVLPRLRSPAMSYSTTRARASMEKPVSTSL